MLEWKIPEFDYELLLLMKETDPWAFWGYGLHMILIFGILTYGVCSYFFSRRRHKKKMGGVKIITFADRRERGRLVK